MLDTEIAALDLRTQLADETLDHRWWVAAPAPTWKGYVEGAQGGLSPSSTQRDFALRYMRRLNQQLADGGAWIVAWAEPAKRPHPLLVGVEVEIYTRLISLWKDRDGDVRYSCDCDDLLRDLLKPGVTDVLVSQAAEAQRVFKEVWKDTGFDKLPTIKAAQGERSADPLVKVPFL